MNLVVLDINPSVSGISGDMLSAALLGLIDDPNEIISKIQAMIQENYPQVRISLSDKQYEGFRGLHLQLENEKIKVENDRLHELILSYLEKCQINQHYSEIATKALNLLFTAEKHVHSSEKAHLHELGMVDTLIDLIIPVLVLDQLQVDYVNIHPIATGTGNVGTSHGVLPVPAPATQFILEKHALPTTQGPQGEATTPTGASLIAILRETFSSSQNTIWKKSSFGFGTKNFEDRGNFLRVRIGDQTPQIQQIEILETNIDDISGEFLGHAVGRLLAEGALDVSYYPIFGKKNRPGYTLRVLAHRQATADIAEKIMTLTGTLGIRIISVDRHIGQRTVETRSIYVKEWEREVQVRVKIGTRTKYEFEDLAELSNEMNISPLQVEEILNTNFRWEK